MTQTQFQERLDRFGPDLSLWPTTLRAEAEAAMAADPALARLLTIDRMLAAALADLPVTAASADLRQRVLTLPLDHPRTNAGPGPLALLRGYLRQGWRQWSAGMATACMAGILGFALGYGQVLPAAAVESDALTAAEDLVSLLSLSAPYETAEQELVQ